MSSARVELKITIAKLLEVAYSKNKGLTTQIIKEKGSFRLTVNEHGNARLSGKLGIISFSAQNTLDRIGLNIKTINIHFSNAGNMKAKYHAMVDLKSAKIVISGHIDIEELITSCSGLLCHAARAMKNRNHAYDRELQRVMGD